MPGTTAAPAGQPKVFDNYAATPSSWGGNSLGLGSTMFGGGNVGGNTGPSTTTNNSSATNTASDSQTTTHETNTSHTHVQNMDDASLAALDKLIAQLQSGGTDAMLVDRANRLAAVLSAQQQQAAYSKDAAFKDARGAMDQQTRQIMQSILPQMTRSAEGAGTSQNSLRALLQQQASSQAAEAASTIGLKAASDYGQVANGISSILAQLVAIKDPAADALLSALGIAKGAVQDSTTTENKDGWSKTHTTGSSITNGTSTTMTNPGMATGISPGGGGSSYGAQSYAPQAPRTTAAFNPNDMMMSFGPAYSTGLSGTNTGSNGFGNSYGESGQGIAGYLNDGITWG